MARNSLTVIHWNCPSICTTRRQGIEVERKRGCPSNGIIAVEVSGLQGIKARGANQIVPKIVRMDWSMVTFMPFLNDEASLWSTVQVIKGDLQE